MTQEQALAVVRDAIKTQDPDIKDYTPESDLSSLGIDSLDVLAIAMVVEDKYCVDFPNSALNKIYKIQDFVDVVMTYIPESRKAR